MDEITNSILDDSDLQGNIGQAQIGVMGIRNDAAPRGVGLYMRQTASTSSIRSLKATGMHLIGINSV
jgi:hypothetical protein